MSDDASIFIGRPEKTQNGDWRRKDEPSDLLWARDSKWSYDDFSGRAAIYESATESSPLKVDLFIHELDIRLEEHIQLSTHIGETFGIACFGKAPMRLTFSAVLADTQKTYGKMYLVDAYKNKLRLGAVARRGKIPMLVYANHAFEGPFISMQINENVNSADTLIVVFTMLLTAMQVTGNGPVVLLDYAHGLETENPTAFIGNPYANLSMQTESEDEEVRIMRAFEDEIYGEKKGSSGNEEQNSEQQQELPPYAKP